MQLTTNYAGALVVGLEHDRVTVRLLCEEIGVSVRTARNLFIRLRLRGLYDRHSAGRYTYYTITPAGVHFARGCVALGLVPGPAEVAA